MTDNDTKKALKCCVSVGNNCPKCPYFTLRFKGVHCKLRMLQDALALINRQEEKVEDLQRIVGLMSKRKYYRKFVDEVFRKQKGKELSDPDFDYIYQLFFEQKAEIERLQKTEYILPARHCGKSQMVRVKLDEIRAEAIKEFADIVIGTFYWDEEIPNSVYNKVSTTIRNIVKEMVGERE